MLVIVVTGEGLRWLSGESAVGDWKIWYLYYGVCGETIRGRVTLSDNKNSESIRDIHGYPHQTWATAVVIT